MKRSGNRVLQWGFACRAIENLPAGWIDLLGEKEAGSMLHLFEKGDIVIAEQPGVGGLDGGRLLRVEEPGARERRE